jgi:hypothetical protein
MLSSLGASPQTPRVGFAEFWAWNALMESNYSSFFLLEDMAVQWSYTYMYSERWAVNKLTQNLLIIKSILEEQVFLILI